MKILLVATQYRTGERIYNTIPMLAKKYNLDLLRLYQMKSHYPWPGNVNMVKHFDSLYLKYFYEIYEYIDDVDYSKYDLIIFDDNRERNNLDTIYRMNRKCPIVACEHGNRDLIKLDSLKNKGVVFDYGFVFGKKTAKNELIPVGIPSNDSLRKYQNVEKEHILIIVNFLGNRSAPFKTFDKKVFNELPLYELQEKYDAPVVIKLKSREDEGGYKHNLDYLREVVPNNVNYKVIVDCDDDNMLIAQSYCVISAPSTMAFKPIQLGIPTVLLKHTGQHGLFYDFDGMVDIDRHIILQKLSNQTKQEQFIRNTVEGGIDFTSTEIFLKEVDKLCEK